MRVKLGIRADTYMPGGQVGEDIDVVATEDAPGIYEFTGQLEQFPVLKTPSNFPVSSLTFTMSTTMDPMPLSSLTRDLANKRKS